MSKIYNHLSNLNNSNKPSYSTTSIQSHGVLLVLKEPQLTIQQVSGNTWNFLGLHPQFLLNKRLKDIINVKQFKTIKNGLKGDLEYLNPLDLSIQCRNKTLWLNGIIHRSNQLIILELEPKDIDKTYNYFGFYHLIKNPIAQMQKARTIDEICQVIVREIREITGFDRVAIYRLEADGSGGIIAEEKAENLTSFLGWHYAASDISESAKQLSLNNLLRFIPDLNYEPISLIPEINPVTQQPLDMSFSILRSVSPFYIEYLKNMGVAATMTVSLLGGQKLWGTIACYHQTPKYISYQIRTVCEFLGRAMALELGAKEDRQYLDYQLKLKSIQSTFIEAISQADNLLDVLVVDSNRLLELVGAEGAIVYLDEQLIYLGKTPNSQEIQDLIGWIGSQIEQDIFYTDSLAKLYPAAEVFKEVGSGLLVLSISKIHKYCILWFRPEILEIVKLSDDIKDSITVKTEDECKGLTPHQSFARWKETVRLTSLPWQECEIESALELRSAIVGILLRKAEELMEIKAQLEVRVTERTAELMEANNQLQYELLQRQKAEVALRQQVERERLMATISQQIRKSLNLKEILHTSVNEVQALLQADRVLVYRIWDNGSGSAIAEATAPGWLRILDIVFPEETFPEECRWRYLQGGIYALTDRDNGEVLPCLVEFLEQIQVRAKLVVPIVQQDILWGLLIAHQCSQSREWQFWEITLLQQLANQMAIAIQQSEIYQQLQEELRERKQAETALRESEMKFRSLSDCSHIGIFLVDSEGRFTYTNPRCQAICGCTFTEALGRGWEHFIHPEERQELLSRWRNAVSNNGGFVSEARYIHLESKLHFCRVQTSPLVTPEGELMGHVGTIEDITESRAIAQMKNEFISIVSHELRTPLTAIHGSLGLLANGVYDRKPQRGKQMLQIAATQTERLVRLVNDILDLGRLESGRVTLIKQSYDAAALMLQAADGMGGNAEQNNINLSVNPLNILVWADPDAIVQTLTNLISNAIKFSAPGSTIWLTAELIQNNISQETEKLTDEREIVLFSVKDRGRGIPPDKLETIFGQFQQVDASDSRQKGGTGLGLAICRSIIQQHSGKIWVESVLGEGSTFYFTLPLPPDR
ncbi:GAF domain-containing protein [Limnofasciculus baicalensis]|uniref:histidine kinase n=1 Tax=Limnofasciculus baicalensis BBK-W-15 TaxID=2699891 RepID=A0AAE3KMD6_9CYAN|nr:GAF domain-containing protein [Limnofasciculus baicalensis]MCP2728716.1 GAF domain-containing protein [Limnofasciculus baicalensis BBK-W-15]